MQYVLRVAKQNRIFIYKIALVEYCLVFQVYLYENVFNSIPAQMISYQPSVEPTVDLKDEMEFSTAFRTASFFYDYHLLKIY